MKANVVACVVVCVVALIWMAATSSAAASALAASEITIDIDPQPAVVGQPMTVTAFDADGPLDVDVGIETRPASQLAERVTVGRLDADGTLTFVPERPGLVRLTLHDPADGSELVVHDVAVHAPTAPVGAIVVLLTAGLLLFGGVLVGVTGDAREEVKR